MKIRDRRLIAAAGWLGTRLARLLSASLRFEYCSEGPVLVDPLQSPKREGFIYALWHENFLIPIVRFGNPDVAALVSGHADGKLLGTLLRATGTRVVHGSSSRGGVGAVRALLRTRLGHLAMTPDGPRGPRRVVQPGIVYLASRSGMRIVPIGVGHRRPWRMKTWDSLAIPRPFSRVRCLHGRPIAIPAHLGADGLRDYAKIVQLELDRVTSAAQQWAESGNLELPPVVHHGRLPVVQHPADHGSRAGVVRESSG